MKNALFIFFFLKMIISYGQTVPSFNAVQLKIFIDSSVTNYDLKLEIEEFLKIQQIEIATNNSEFCNLLLAFDGTNYTLVELPKNLIIYKISNSKPNKTSQIIKDKINQYAHGYKVKKISLKNPSYAFKFRIKPVEFNNTKIGKDIPIESYSKTDGVLNFNINDSIALLEITNLSKNPIYFSIIKINRKGELSSFIPNFDCALLGSQRRLEPNQTITVESCIFNINPPFETIILKGFATSEPINFDPIIKNENNSSLDYIKSKYNDMFTYEFIYNTTDKNGKMPHYVSVDYFEPKTSSELEAAFVELTLIETKNGKLTSEYITSLKDISRLNKVLGNSEEALKFEIEAAKLKMQLDRNKESSSRLNSDKTRQEVAKEAERFAKMTDAEKVVYLVKDNHLKKSEILKLKTQIDSLTNKLNSLSTQELVNVQMRGSKAIKNETNLLSEFTYRALIIAKQDYIDETIKDLKFPISDAKKLEKILVSNYAFNKTNIIFLENPSRNEIFKALHSIYKVSSSTDHLLIFYAGHGVYDEGFNRGYWLPSDADIENKGTWMSNLDIKDYITNIKTKHTLLISDACFSGSIFEYNRDVEIDKTSPVVKKLLTKNGRNAMTSGLDNPVPDKSVFIQYLLKTLSENEKGYLRASDLFNSIQEVVISNTDNIPQYGVIKNANHEGGEFIFLKRE